MDALREQIDPQMEKELFPVSSVTTEVSHDSGMCRMTRTVED